MTSTEKAQDAAYERQAKATPTGTMKREGHRALVSSGQEASPVSSRMCLYCDKGNHDINECYNFMKLSMTEKDEHVKKNGLCFSCLRKGHISKACSEKRTCKTCNKGHPTCLHRDRPPPSTEAKGKASNSASSDGDVASSSGGVARGNSSVVCSKVPKGSTQASLFSMVVPVWVSCKSDPKDEYLCYAMLDTQSDTSFILTHTADKLKAERTQTTLRLSTMTSREKSIACSKLKGLQVRGYNSNTLINLPATYTREFIPIDRSHIGTPDSARKWPHLCQIADEMIPLQDCEVGLLLGYNAPEALAPLKCIPGQGSEPYGVLCSLGWSIVGSANLDLREDSGDAIGVTHRVVTRIISDNLAPQGCGSHPHDDKLVLQDQVQFTCKTELTEEVLSPAYAIKALEGDFGPIEPGTSREIDLLSQEDILFLKIMKAQTHQQDDGHYAMPLPFRSRPVLPDNRAIAMKRLNLLKRKFAANPTYKERYQMFMKTILDKSEAERVREECKDGEVWYIPHHGVYHPKKPGKLRVVFEASSKYKGQSLNDHLLQGPDLTNNLTGVLLRFRQERVAVSCDIERMFHQFRVVEQDRNYLSFLWFVDNDLNEVADFRMKVHLFGATSSPGCSNYGLKQIATDNEDEFPEAAHFIKSGFYVDDGLFSVSTVDSANKLVADSRAMCMKGNVRLHKFISNERGVLEALPASELTADAMNLNLALGPLPIERSLGIEWCVESDTFQFRLSLKDQPLTRLGILSTVASVFDPLGFLAPFVLIGKQILQDLCKECADWDDPVSESVRKRWERWRDDLALLPNVSIPRCTKTKSIGEGEVRNVQIHHFCDASVTGYGQCSYLRVTNANGSITCTLLMGKARVVPLKVITIPRLELQAAVTAVKISKILKSELHYDNVEEYFWSDSKVALACIKTMPGGFMYMLLTVCNSFETTLNRTSGFM